MQTSNLKRSAHIRQFALCACAFWLLLAGNAVHARILRGGKPVISGTPSTIDSVGTLYTFTPTASVPHGDTLSFSVHNLPSWATFSIATGTVSGTPTAANVGTYSDIVISVSDGVSSASLAPFSITVSQPASAATAPLTISGSPSSAAEVGEPYSFTPTVQNASGQAVSFSIANKPAWAGFSIATGTLSGTPSASDVGTDSGIVIAASNGQSSASLPAFAISVSTATSSPPPSSTPAGGGASELFSYPNFAAEPSAITIFPDAATYSGNVIDVCNGLVGQHESGQAYYTTPLNITSFTTDFTFQIGVGGYGMTFIIQNDPRGLQAAGDTNGIGYFAYAPPTNPTDTAIENSIAIAFNSTPNNGSDTVEAAPSLTGLYIDGGNFIEYGIDPVLDLTPQNINLQSGDVMDAHITYDGAILTMVLTDTKTGAQARFSWPVDIPAIVGGNTAYVGFGAGTIPPVVESVNSWSWWQGINTRLASPTFSIAAGSYTSSQTVSISGPSGASIYYTTNGKPPTTGSTLYTGPITVTSSEYVQAVAVESGYTDSFVAGANYSIGSSGTPPINFPSGFANAGGLFSTVGTASINGSAIQLTDLTQVSEVGAAWYVAPVNIQSFTTSFTMKFTDALAYGMAFVIQNQNAASTDTSSLQVSGGPYNLGGPIDGLGYQDTMSSVAVTFDLFTGSGNVTGIYTNGAVPTTSPTPITGITLASGDPINVTLTYDGTTLSLSMEDTVTGGEFSTSWPIDIPAAVGGDTAYIGFTGTTNWNQDAIQTITALTFHN